MILSLIDLLVLAAEAPDDNLALFKKWAWIVGLLLVWGYMAIPDWLKQRRLKKQLAIDGREMRAWLVMANKGLYKSGFSNLPALVLISSPDERGASDEEVAELAQRMGELRGVKNRGPLEESVGQIVDDETAVDGVGGLLPRAFTGYKDVFWLSIVVRRFKLPGRKLDRPYVHVMAARHENDITYRMIEYPDA